MRLIGPRRGHARCRRACPPRSLPKSTSAWNGADVAGAQRVALLAGRATTPGLPTVPATSLTSGIGSSKRNATLKNAGGCGSAPAPPGVVAVAAAAGDAGSVSAASSHRPTPAASRTVLDARVPGRVRDAHLDLAVRRESTDTVRLRAARRAAVGVDAARPACPCTVRNSSAGALTLAPCGNGTRRRARRRSRSCAATRPGPSSVFSVRRNAVASAQRPHAQLDEVGGVVRVGRVGRIRVGAVAAGRTCRRRCAGRRGRAGRRWRRGRRRGSPGRRTRRRGRRRRRRRGSGPRASSPCCAAAARRPAARRGCRGPAAARRRGRARPSSARAGGAAIAATAATPAAMSPIRTARDPSRPAAADAPVLRVSGRTATRAWSRRAPAAP